RIVALPRPSNFGGWKQAIPNLDRTGNRCVSSVLGRQFAAKCSSAVAGPRASFVRGCRDPGGVGAGVTDGETGPGDTGRPGLLGSGRGEVVRRGDGGGAGAQPAVGLVDRLVGERGGDREVGAREAAGQVAAVGAAD